MNRNKKIGVTFIKNEITRSFWINRLINKLAKDGQKSIVEKKLYHLMLFFKKKRVNASLLFFYVFELLRPVLLAKPHTVRGKVKLVPAKVSTEEQYNKALSWFTKAVQNSSERFFELRVLRELFKIILYRRSRALKYKKKLYRTVIKNRTLVNFRT